MLSQSGADAPSATEHSVDTLLNTGAEDPQAAVARLRAEVAALTKQNTKLQEDLELRNRALNTTTAHFAICKRTEPPGEILYVNRALAECNGYSIEELIGQPITVLIPPNWSDNERIEALGKLESGEPYRFEQLMQRKDGSTFIVGATIVPMLDDNGRLTHTITIGADITARIEAERRQQVLQQQLIDEMNERERIAIELRLAQKLESVGRLAAGVAHEINTPIQFVSDSLYFLRSSFDDLVALIDSCKAAIDLLPNNDQTKPVLDSLAAAQDKADLAFLLQEMPNAFERTFEGANRVASIVRAMKEFAHPDGNEQSPADINHALQTTLIVASNEYKYLAAVTTDFAELPPVMCNIGELNQVFLNMIVNAAHAVQDSGKDAHRGGEISIATALNGDRVEITIADNGCGIPQEHLDKIYDPFFTTKEVGRGTGQGLAITRSIVIEKHRGDIRVNSTVGAGTRFTLCLPVDGANAKHETN